MGASAAGLSLVASTRKRGAAVSDILQDWITEKDFAEAVGVSLRTAKRWRHLGTGPKHSQAGKKLIVHHKDDVQDWLNRGGLAAAPVSVSRRKRVRS